MDRFTMKDLKQLVESSQSPCATICMPTHRSGGDREQDAVRLKNLANQIEKELAGRWLRAPDARDWVEPIRNIPSESDFWEKRDRGLAIFLDGKSVQRFRVPIPLSELAIVGSRFHTKSLLPLLSNNRFLVLALSQNKVSLFEATEFQIDPIEVDGLPQNIDEALDLISVDRGSQSHFAMKGGKGKESSVFHGQGGVKETHKDELTLFFRMIDSALQPFLRHRSVPLVLAGVDYLLPLFRAVSHYAHIAATEIRGNWDYSHADEIHEQAWQSVKSLLHEKRKQAFEKFQRLNGTGLATDDISQLLPAAFDGRLETLFVVPDHYSWGVASPIGRLISLHNTRERDDDDLSDAVATQTLLHHGQVYVLQQEEMPSKSVQAGVMRF